ncbi:MAG: DUF4190 domain-containing protein [Clostridia bacterium]|nr:DUF4190 domain-containing protein [Clostridia bacterium]
MNENKNNDIKFEDLVDNYTYQQSEDQNKQNSEEKPIWSEKSQAPKENGYNIASLVLGILSIVCCCTYGVFSIIAGVLAIVFFVISKNKGTSNGMALAGLICAIFGILLGILYFSMVIFMFDDIFSMMEDAMNSTTELL